MEHFIQEIIFQKYEIGQEIPYELLLLADPSKELVDKYLENSDLYLAKINDIVVGVIALFPISDDSVEIKNIAVKQEYQGKGIGSYLINQAVQITKLNGKKSICIGTANSSISQLYIYQKNGFEISSIIQNFFINNYSEPIFENGIQAKHMIMLTKVLF